jgi:sigma-B regulation protein RsbU (phosphoserine phosphatase)
VDVDDRRRAQESRERQTEEQLAFAREFEGWILAIVSHDIRNPLGAINGSAHVLATHAENDPTVRSLAERISRSSNRIARIVADLLDVARERHGGGIPIVLGPSDVHDVCRDIVDEFSMTATDRNIEVLCQGDARGTWDSQRIAQAISNLVGNAVQHSPAGSDVVVEIRGENDRVAIEVRNDGTIPPESLPTIFAPFGAGERARRRHQGLGLGLFIAQAIVRAHHGNIEVHSDAESGTTFRVALPRAIGSAGSVGS